ncbi:MAG: TrkA family potassium uptake protein, partial [Desulfuromonadales bacterium]|nr:TrkA family potassium uptake protein [Desulfuromonadales bacterium]NIR33789.1 TrkA family potassium uptake protein [Desulfuromonadales bacterium]NIS41367.1 TrkA family potassium uptake protein [Desulfuromonadales bacterium]
MRIVFVGAGELTVDTAQLLVERGHEVVIIEKDEERLSELDDQLDCSFLHGDGSKPNILKEVAPEHTHFLFCLSDNDQYN